MSSAVTGVTGYYQVKSKYWARFSCGLCTSVRRRNGLMVSAFVPGARCPGSSIALCSWASHLTLTMPLSSQEFKWVPANYWGNLTNCGKVTCNGLVFRPGGVEILPAASFYGNRNKLRQHEPYFLASRLHFFCTSVQRGPTTMFVTSDGEWWKLYSLYTSTW